MRQTLVLTLLVAGGLTSPSAISSGEPGSEPCAVPALEPARPPSPGAAWIVLEGCANDAPIDPRTDTDYQQMFARTLQCGEAVRTIVNAGTDADRDRLLSVFDGLGDDSPMAADVIDALLDWHVERALADLEDSAPPAPEQARVADIPLPGFLIRAPVELQQAWRTYQAITRKEAQPRERRPAEDAISFQANEPAFRRTIAGFLRQRVSAAEAAREVSRYEWGGWCGTGSGALYGPQSKVLVIAHLEGGRPDLALAASEGLDFQMMGHDDQPTRWDRRLLAASGIDWERFYVGGVLSGEPDLANELACHGSDRAARQLLTVAQWVAAAEDNDVAKDGARDRDTETTIAEDPAMDAATGDEEQLPDTESLLWPLAAMVDPSGECTGYGTSDSRDVVRDPEAGPIAGEVQEGVLEFLARNVRPGAGLSEAESASHLLVRSCREESLQAFRVMLESQYEGVRKKGAIGLRAFGGTFSEPRPSRPVAFRVVVDGKPVAQRKVEWSLESPEGGETTSSAESDRDGLVRIARDPFVDPKKPVTSVRLSAPELAAATDVWFDAGTDTPENLDALSTVSVRTGTLSVVVPRSLMTDADGRGPILRLLAEVSRYGADDLILPISGELPVASTRISFPKLQHGRYQVWLQRGNTMHASPAVEVGERPATVTVSERSMEEELAERVGQVPPP